MKKKQFWLNGRFSGVWYELDDGRTAYLAHRTGKGELKDGMRFWAIESRLVFDLVDKKIDVIGVVSKDGIWAMPLHKFTSSPHVFQTKDKRGFKYDCLQLSRFDIDPHNDESYLSRKTRLRK